MRASTQISVDTLVAGTLAAIDPFELSRQGNEAAGESMRAARDVKVTLGVGIALVVAVSALVLTRSPPRVVRVGVKTLVRGPTIPGTAEVCQANEVLPAGVSAIRLSLVGFYGARVGVRAYSGSRVLTEGRRGPDWTGTSVTVPVTPLDRTASHVKLCIDVGPNSEPIYLEGIETSTRETAVAHSGQPLDSRVGVEYLAAGRGSWWSRVLSVARHIGIGHLLSGTWVALLIAVLMAAVGALAIRLTLRELP